MDKINIEQVSFGIGTNEANWDDVYYMTIIPILDYICEKHNINLTYPKTLEQFEKTYYKSILKDINDPKEKQRILTIFKKYLQENCLRDIDVHNALLPEPFIEVFDIGIYNALGECSRSTNLGIVLREAGIEDLDQESYEQYHNLGVRILCKNSINLMDNGLNGEKLKRIWERQHLSTSDKTKKLKQLTKNRTLFTNSNY